MLSQQIHSSGDVKIVAAMWMVSQCGGIHEAKEALQRLEELGTASSSKHSTRQCKQKSRRK